MYDNLKAGLGVYPKEVFHEIVNGIYNCMKNKVEYICVFANSFFTFDFNPDNSSYKITISSCNLNQDNFIGKFAFNAGTIIECVDLDELKDKFNTDYIQNTVFSPLTKSQLKMLVYCIEEVNLRLKEDHILNEYKKIEEEYNGLKKKYSEIQDTMRTIQLTAGYTFDPKFVDRIRNALKGT
jgi:hypothetical protein